jgi:Fic-DOC domain mobile mystery protein B
VNCTDDYLALFGIGLEHSEKRVKTWGRCCSIQIELRILLDDARYWIEHETYSPAELAVRFHHRLVFIHAFPNGNGRHARIMADAILEKILKAPPIGWAGGHRLETMNERRTDYIAALRSADRGDMAPLLKFARAQ